MNVTKVALVVALLLSAALLVDFLAFSRGSSSLNSSSFSSSFVSRQRYRDADDLLDSPPSSSPLQSPPTPAPPPLTFDPTDETTDQLPKLAQVLRTRLDAAEILVSQLPPLPVVSTQNGAPPPGSSAAWAFSDIASTALELIPNTTYGATFARPFLRWPLFRESDAPPSSSSSAGGPARVACLYAGFLRDVEFMLRSCKPSRRGPGCGNKKFRRKFGYQWERLLQPLDCDVFISTWHIRGGGRYDTTTYDTKQVLAPDMAAQLQQLYNGNLAVMHVHNYTRHDSLWHHAHRFRRSFPQIRPSKRGGFPDGEHMFATEDDWHETMRLNDFSQAMKHYCAVFLTGLYEKWGRGSYDSYIRMRTDTRVVKVFGDSPRVFYSGSERLVSVTVCAAPGHAGGGIPQKAMMYARVVNNNNNATAAAAPGDNNGNATIVSNVTQVACALVKVSAAGSSSSAVQRLAVNNYDISDFCYFGSPRAIKRLGEQVWEMASAEATSDVPVFPYPQVIQLLPHLSSNFSEYNLIMWRLLLDKERYSVGSLYSAFRVSRLTVKK